MFRSQSPRKSKQFTILHCNTTTSTTTTVTATTTVAAVTTATVTTATTANTTTATTTAPNRRGLCNPYLITTYAF
jgi:transcription elongation factor Elf1